MVVMYLTRTWLSLRPTARWGSFPKDDRHSVGTVCEMEQRGKERGPSSRLKRLRSGAAVHSWTAVTASAYICIGVVLT